MTKTVFIKIVDVKYFISCLDGANITARRQDDKNKGISK